ncbi:hypothetical protein [Cognatilysobacter xinjiangensis]|uniref:hypothetical protein n=1 Tax=Cognatilysobacter xinjiangensis TaxID=546892 RepID=UPI001676D268|nr:hypothetical protein [Lysobacter xinjiangensis]
MKTDLPPALDALTQDLAHRSALIEVLQAVEALTRDRNRAVELICSEPLRVFDGLTAAELVVRNRAPDVLAYLESISSGAVG